MTTPEDIYHDSMMSHLVDIDNLSEDDLRYLADHLSDLSFAKSKREVVHPMGEYGRTLLADMENMFAPYLKKS